MSSWININERLKCIITMYNYNVFGSDDSQDYDIMIFVDKIPSTQESKEMCLKTESEFQLMYSKLVYKKV